MVESVFVTQLSTDVGICLKNYLGYNKSPFYERYVNQTYETEITFA